MKRALYMILGICGALLGCSQDECSEQDMAHCSDSGDALYICHDGSWKSMVCDKGERCGYLDGVPQCMNPSVQCTPGAVLCKNDILRTCNEGKWVYEPCRAGQTCKDNACVSSSEGGENPSTSEYSGVVERKCTVDGHGIKFINADGSVTSRTCKEEVGFDSRCESYGAGHVGCALPDACNDVFSNEGTCVGERRLFCDEQYIVPKPAMEDCVSQGKVCDVYAGKAGCFDTCNQSSGLSCVNDGGVEEVSQCVRAGSADVKRKAKSMCLDAGTQAECQNGAVLQTKCAADEKCIDSTGRCTLVCAKDKVGDMRCSDTGEVLVCGKVAEEYVYISQGKRHCVEEHLLQCLMDEADSTYHLKNVNCQAYENPDGTTTVGRCIMNYDYYEDFDLCIADEGGEPCGNLKEAGTCDGNILKYCDEMFGYAVAADCSKNSFGYTKCSVYEGYSDCRMPCKKSGEASCTYNSNSEMYDLTLCAPDERNQSLTEIYGTSICLGNILYECDEQGKAKKTDCTVNGGRCDSNACVYPACSLVQKPACMADNVMISCEVDEDGMVVGSAMSTMTCRPDGECMVCRNGESVMWKEQ